MFSPSITKPNFRLAQREAIRLLNEVGIYEPPVNPVRVANSIGVNVRFVAFSGESEDIAGLYDPSADEILVNQAESGVRQTFTVAHELGHRVLHREWAESQAYQVLWRDPSRQGKDRFEIEANQFAANLLMPKDFVDEYRYLPAASLARIFAVSEQVATIRLSKLYGF